MAGGVGSRFWPMSRRARPKHLLPLGNGIPLLDATIQRILPITPIKNLNIVTNDYQYRRIKEIMPYLERESFVLEPFGRNTAPCIGLAAMKIKALNPQAVMIVLPADHIIENVSEFQRCLKLAVDLAEAGDSLITLGIKPTRAETGYGYIQRNHQVSEGEPSVYQVKTFAEKPNLALAEKFLQSGDFYWNSGIFIWRVDTILKLLETLLPDLYQQLNRIEKYSDQVDADKKIRKVYRSIRPISIDYGIMEKAPSVKVIEGTFGWCDIGSWEEAYRRATKDDQGNALVGEHLMHNSFNCYINSPRKFVAVVGLQDIIVVDSKNALLVCHRCVAQEVKEVVEKLERMKAKKYL
jgi:mannose-1-phosphate guanylyltransferase